MSDEGHDDWTDANRESLEGAPTPGLAPAGRLAGALS